MVSFGGIVLLVRRKESGMENEALARRLRVLRAERALGLGAASALIGVDRHTLRDMERGTRMPYKSTLGKVARAYGVTVEELLEEEATVPLGEGPSETQLLLRDGLGHDYLTLGPGANLRAAERMSVPEIEARLREVEQENRYLHDLGFFKKLGRLKDKQAEAKRMKRHYYEILAELGTLALKKDAASDEADEKAS